MARVVEAVVAMAVVVALAVTVGALMASAAVVAVLTRSPKLSVALVQLQLIPLGQDCFSLHVPMC